MKETDGGQELEVALLDKSNLDMLSPVLLLVLSYSFLFLSFFLSFIAPYLEFNELGGSTRFVLRPHHAQDGPLSPSRDDLLHKPIETFVVIAYQSYCNLLFYKSNPKRRNNKKDSKGREAPG